MGERSVDNEINSLNKNIRKKIFNNKQPRKTLQKEIINNVTLKHSTSITVPVNGSNKECLIPRQLNFEEKSKFIR